MHNIDGISVIIPFFRKGRNENLVRLRESLNSGSLKPDEIIVIENVSPASAARNIGAKRASGKILVFCDDDAIIEDERLLEKVIATLLSDENIGLVGTAIGIPKKSSWFQQYYAKQYSRSSTEISAEISDRFMITPLFCAVRKCDFDKVGGFDEKLIGGEDRYFCHTIRKLGKRVVIAPNTVIYHPPPKNISELIRREIWYGSSKARIADIPDFPTDKTVLKSKYMAVLYLIAHTFVFPLRFFIGGRDGKSIGFWPLRALGHYVHAISYAIAVLKK